MERNILHRLGRQQVSQQIKQQVSQQVRQQIKQQVRKQTTGQTTVQATNQTTGWTTGWTTDIFLMMQHISQIHWNIFVTPKRKTKRAKKQPQQNYILRSFPVQAFDNVTSLQQ